LVIASFLVLGDFAAFLGVVFGAASFFGTVTVFCGVSFLDSSAGFAIVFVISFAEGFAAVGFFTTAFLVSGFFAFAETFSFAVGKTFVTSCFFTTAFSF